MASAKQLDRATTMIKSADQVVLDVDAVVRGKITTKLAAKARSAEKGIPKAQKSLEDAVVLIDDAMPALNDDEQERALVLKRTAEARLEMLEAAEPVLVANEHAAAAVPLASDAWKSVLAAETKVDRAVKRYNALNTKGVTESRRLNGQAIATLRAAKTKFSAAEKAFPELDASAYLKYIDAKIRLVTLSRKSDDAWLDKNITRANSLAQKYNAEEKRVLALGKKLPAGPTAIIADAYDEATKDYVTAYFLARNKAARADAELREL
jgi:hypothetical protein